VSGVVIGSFKLMTQQQRSIIDGQADIMDNQQLSLLQNYAFALNRKDAKGKKVIDAKSLEIKVLTKQLKATAVIMAAEKVAYNIKVKEANSTQPKQTTFGKSLKAQ
tara:strand:- start:219 stop:536 length:318 start_codon:yes stop_codon:yes gene_type:complete